MLGIFSITTFGRAQQWQHIITLDTRLGYSTNSYLNPFLSEWDSTAASGYNLTSLMGQSYWYQNNHSVSLTGGFVYEPLFRNRDYWKGGLALANYNYRFSNNFSVGGEAGLSYFANSYSRTLFWIQPKINWFISPFTLMRFKAGTNFRGYQNYPDGQSDSNRFDLYGLEFETWPGYQWQLSAGLYGSLNTLPSFGEGFNSRTSVGYFFRNGATLRLNVGLEQYQTEITEQDGPGGPPGGFPPNRPSGSTVTYTDRIFRLGLDSSYPINENFSVFASAEMLRFDSETSNTIENDYEISGGIRFSLEPKFSQKRGVVSPEWQISSESQQITVRYSGEGRLYLVGDFNNWDRTGISLRKQTDNTYVTKLSLSKGAYEYKILRIQGGADEWLKFSDDTYTVSDGFGSENAMLLVE
jgi:hypothetical protein